jgi:hypothetical protein
MDIRATCPPLGKEEKREEAQLEETDYSTSKTQINLMKITIQGVELD